jgi:hypothetical protein
VNFEEYKPEKSPSLNSEKLSIKLPPEEFHWGMQPIYQVMWRITHHNLY